jgi:hypothetical protein
LRPTEERAEDRKMLDIPRKSYCSHMPNRGPSTRTSAAVFGDDGPALKLDESMTSAKKATPRKVHGWRTTAGICRQIRGPAPPSHGDIGNDHRARTGGSSVKGPPPRRLRDTRSNAR